MDLPARAVATAVSAATASLLKTVAAVHRLVASWLERHACLATTRGASCGIHLTGGAIASVGASGHRRLACGSALGAARRGVHQAATGIEFLLTNRENEITAAFATPQCLIGGQTWFPLLRLIHASSK